MNTLIKVGDAGLNLDQMSDWYDDGTSISVHFGNDGEEPPFVIDNPDHANALRTYLNHHATDVVTWQGRELSAQKTLQALRLRLRSYADDLEQVDEWSEGIARDLRAFASEDISL